MKLQDSLVLILAQLHYENDTAHVFRIYAGASDSLGFAAGNSYNADHLTIASDGKVGIGTTAPSGRP